MLDRNFSGSNRPADKRHRIKSCIEVALPTDETRRLLKVFGVAVTAFEDAVDKTGSAESGAKPNMKFAPAPRSYRADRPAAGEEEVIFRGRFGWAFNHRRKYMSDAKAQRFF
mgnify:CR=1 FL=1